MTKKGGVKLFLIISIIVIVLLVLICVFFVKPFSPNKSAIKEKTSDDIKPSGPEIKTIEKQKENNINLGEQIKESNGAGGAGGGGGESPGGGPESSEPGAGETPEQLEEETEDPDEPEDFELTVALSLLDFDYQIVENDLVEVTSIRYNVENLNKDPLKFELLLYIYDEDDDGSKKGFVRDQIFIGQLDYSESITKTVDVSGYYRGDLTSEKTIKITLIGYFLERSYNLGSAYNQITFV